ncbi:methyltransferase [Rhizobium grahamii]|uniref:N-methyl-transferase n=1 Tax=Rhizobium grahamii CCGE 502 TaxID=990285 RepID=S3HJJ1_9HYPH|nr:methyltransferase [Rhizobium grahamii]EPE93711.1 N-methyl-transferase [Rhizobium grahamii CCGE 502]
MDTLNEVRAKLARSQQQSFPIHMEEFGLNLVVNEGVFPPAEFQSWRWLGENFPPFQGKAILEIGCGFGLPGLHLAKSGAKSILTCDINPAAVANTIENARRNGINNIRVVQSDIFSNIQTDQLFDLIYWNYPSYYAPDQYQFRDHLERGAVDPGYRLLERFLSEGPSRLNGAGRILLGFGSNARDDLFEAIAKRNLLSATLLRSSPSSDVGVTYRLFSIQKTAPAS